MLNFSFSFWTLILGKTWRRPKQAIFDERYDKFHSATAKTVEEAREFIEAEFEYVCTYTDVMQLRKRK